MKHLLLWIGCALSTQALASDPTRPHSHQGLLTPISAAPAALALSPEEQSRLEKGEVVLRQEQSPGSGKGVAVQLISAPIDTVWSVILDYDRYPERISTLDTCEVYREKGNELYVDMQSSVMGIKFGQYTRNFLYKDQGYMSWTLDYSRSSDVDDMIGYWRLETVSTSPPVTRLEYATELKVGQVPGLLVGFLTRDALRSGTAWVKKYSEGAAR
jgi:ribosome-associated toxin RatA of RatAB toxin-antitoxin module